MILCEKMNSKQTINIPEERLRSTSIIDDKWDTFPVVNLGNFQNLIHRSAKQVRMLRMSRMLRMLRLVIEYNNTYNYRISY